MAVTADKYELPLYVSNYVSDLEKKFNAKNIHSEIARGRNGAVRGYKFLKIEDEESEANMAVFGITPSEALEISCSLTKDLRNSIKVGDRIKYKGSEREGSKNWKEGYVIAKYSTYFIVKNTKGKYNICFSYYDLDQSVVKA